MAEPKTTPATDAKDPKQIKKAMKIAANSAAFRQPMPACPACGKDLVVVSRQQTFGNIAVVVKCSGCKEKVQEKFRT